ncbi:MAG: DUF393 domain-containing protein [Alphaproteobacteria bacterium]|nr:DUF393 domain-containing protein [Alphaproteobacteria bacterium]
MHEAWQGDGVWMLYDGACPMCSSVAHALRIRENYGALHLLNARTASDDPLYREVRRRGLDLDEGMVVAADGRLHHGADAVTFMARFGAPASPLSTVVNAVLRYRWAVDLTDPQPRAIRNGLLKRRGIGRTDTLGKDA